MQIKLGALIVIISLTGAALAMAFSGKEEEFFNPTEAASKSNSTDSKQVVAPPQQIKSDSSFDLSSIKRMSPKPNKNSALFQSKSWYSPPPAPKPQLSALPPPAPTAPQLSFAFAGRMIDGDQMILFLSKNGRQYTVKIGDILDDTYRLDKVSNIDAVLTYLPMNIQQTLTFNSTAIGAITTNEPQKSPAVQTTPSLFSQNTPH